MYVFIKPVDQSFYKGFIRLALPTGIGPVSCLCQVLISADSPGLVLVQYNYPHRGGPKHYSLCFHFIYHLIVASGPAVRPVSGRGWVRAWDIDPTLSQCIQRAQVHVGITKWGGGSHRRIIRSPSWISITWQDGESSKPVQIQTPSMNIWSGGTRLDVGLWVGIGHLVHCPTHVRVRGRARESLYGRVFNPFIAKAGFRRQNMTSKDVRFWRLTTVPALKERNNL